MTARQKATRFGLQVFHPFRVIQALLAALFLFTALFVPDGWVSEVTWLVLFLGCVGWELVGVFAEGTWRQEPLTRIYRDRLMRMRWTGWIFRAGFLAFFLWWIFHWLIPASGF